MPISDTPQFLYFHCPGCGQRCKVDTRKNTVQHELPTCLTFQRAKPLDFIELAGVGMAEGAALRKRGAS